MGERTYDLDSIGIDDGPVETTPSTEASGDTGTTDATVDAASSDTTSDTEHTESPGEATTERDASSVETTPAADTAPEGVDVDSLTDRERAYIARIEELQQRIIEGAPSVTATQDAATPTAPQEINFVDGVNLDDVFATPESFNKFLNTFYQRTLEQARTLAAENVMSSLPQTITRYVTQHVAMKEMVDTFYKNNQDLAQVKKTLAGVANEVAAEKPELPLDKVFEEAGTRVRKMLGLKAQAAQEEKTPNPNPKPKPTLLRPKGAAPRGGMQETEGDPNSMESRVADLLVL